MLVSSAPAVRVVGLVGLPEIQQGSDLAALIVEAAGASIGEILAGDVFVVAQKIVSKAEGRMVPLGDIQPSPLAIAWGARAGKDARLIEVILRESTRIVRMDRGVLIAETSHGFICANAGVDTSNVEDGYAALLPIDPDASARQLRDRLSEAVRCDVGIVIADTFGRAWREGQINVALGVAGIAALEDYRGRADTRGHELQSTVIATADELAAAAELVMGKARRVPAAVVRFNREAAPTTGDGSARELVRPAERDLFR